MVEYSPASSKNTVNTLNLVLALFRVVVVEILRRKDRSAVEVLYVFISLQERKRIAEPSVYYLARFNRPNTDSINQPILGRFLASLNIQFTVNRNDLTL